LKGLKAETESLSSILITNLVSFNSSLYTSHHIYVNKFFEGSKENFINKYK